MLILKNSTLVLAGDSITDCGRSRELPSRLDSQGDGYVKLFTARFWAKYPELNLTSYNMGVSGDTTLDIRERWEQDVLSKKPDYVSLLIGINDVIRPHLRPHMPETHVKPEDYEVNIRYMIEKTIPHVKKMILISPGYMDINKNDVIRQHNDINRQKLEQLAVEYECIYVDIQKEYDRILEVHYPLWLSWDRIHPNLVGHTIISEALLKAIEDN